jgi:outer membrane protein W
MKWTEILGILGLGLGFATPALADDAAPDTTGDAAEPAPDAAKAEAAPAPASDEPAPVTSSDGGGKFVIGLRLGYALPMGSVDKNSDGSSEKMSDGVSGQFPIWLDLGYMVTPNVMLGLYGQYAFGSLAGEIKAACDQDAQFGVSCSESDIRFGVQGQYHILPTEKVDPWLGLGVGYEMMKISVSGAGQDGSVTLKGFEFANLQGGVDFKPLPNLGVGPFVSFSFGQYGSSSSDGAAASLNQDITNKAIHEWLTFGVRGAFTL